MCVGVGERVCERAYVHICVCVCVCVCACVCVCVLNREGSWLFANRALLLVWTSVYQITVIDQFP